jgi:hypothetical protein
MALQDGLACLSSPSLLLEEEKRLRKVERLANRARSLDVSLRPHMKTAKCVDVSMAATEGCNGLIPVSTLAAAEVLFGEGFGDILHTVGITPEKLAQVLALRARGCDPRQPTASPEGRGLRRVARARPRTARQKPPFRFPPLLTPKHILRTVCYLQLTATRGTAGTRAQGGRLRGPAYCGRGARCVLQPGAGMAATADGPCVQGGMVSPDACGAPFRPGLDWPDNIVHAFERKCAMASAVPRKCAKARQRWTH